MSAESNKCTCSTCGKTWTRGTDGSHSCAVFLMLRLELAQTAMNLAIEAGHLTSTQANAFVDRAAEQMAYRRLNRDENHAIALEKIAYAN
jgi:hypothetical protein